MKIDFRLKYVAVAGLLLLFAADAVLAKPERAKQEPVKKPATAKPAFGKPPATTQPPTQTQPPAKDSASIQPVQPPAVNNTVPQEQPSTEPTQSLNQIQVGETLKWQVLAAGGMHGTGGTFVMDATVGQPVVGVVTGSTFSMSEGFWYSSIGTSGCCIGIRGDVNYNGGITITDITTLVRFLFNSGPTPPCFDEANVNGVGSITIQDITYLVRFLFANGPQPPACP